MVRRAGLLAVAAVVLAGVADAQYVRPARMDETGWLAMGAPAGATTGCVGIFLGSPLSLQCAPSSGIVYTVATKSLDVTDGRVRAGNLNAIALPASGSVTVTPVLSKVGSITTVAGASLADGDYFTIEYAAGNTVPIEFDATPGNGTSGGRVPYVFAPGDTADQIRDGLITLLNTAAGTSLTASSGGAATVSLVLDTPGAAGGTNTENVTNAGFAVTGFANPTAATTYTYSLQACLADGTCNAAGAASTTAAGHATLSASNFNRLSWSAVAGAASYKIRRDVGGASTGVIWSGTALTVDDTGLAGDSSAKQTVDGTGVVTGGRVMVGAGSAAAPSVGFASDSDSGLYSGGSGDIRVTLNGGTPFVFQPDRLIVNGQTYRISFNDTAFLTSPAAATLQLGAADSATPVAQTLQVQGSRGGVDTNVGGASLTIKSGAGTGNGAASSIVFATPSPAGSGSTQQTVGARLSLSSGGAQFAVTPYAVNTDAFDLGVAAAQWRVAYISRSTLGSKSKTLTDGSATAFATVALADGAMTAGEIIYRVTATITGQKQVISGRIRYSAVREGNTYDTDVAEVGTQVASVTTGTLAGSITVAAAEGLLTFSANFDSDQTAPTVTLNYRFDSTDTISPTPL